MGQSAQHKRCQCRHAHKQAACRRQMQCSGRISWPRCTRSIPPRNARRRIASNDGDGFQLSLSDEHAIERIAVFCLEGRGSDRLGNTDRSGCHAQLGVMGQPPQDHVGVRKNSHGLQFSSSCSGRGSTNASVTRPETRPGSRSPFQTKWTESIACASTHSPAFDTLALVGEVLVVPEADQPGGWAPVSGDGHGAPAGLLTAQSRRPPTPGAVPLLQGVVADEAAAETSLEEGDGCHVGADEVEALSLSSFQDLPIQ